MKWSTKKEELLKRVWDLPKEHLLELFPQRTYNSIKSKINQFGFKRRKEIGLDRNFFTTINTPEKAQMDGFFGIMSN